MATSTFTRSQHHRRFNVLSVRCLLVRPQALTESALISSSMEARNRYDTSRICSLRYGLERVCHSTPRTLIVHICKRKGDRAVCDNHRGIPLMSVAGKILARVLLNRLRDHTDSSAVILEIQCGFREGRCVTIMIFSARQIQEKC